MAFLTRASLRNRGLVALITIVVVGFGLFAIPQLKQALFPSLTLPTASLVASYPGAAPDVVEKQVTAPLETQLRGVAGVDQITSTTRQGSAVIQLAFVYGADIDVEVGRIEKAVDSLGAALPSSVTTQVVTGSTDDFPVLQLAVGSTGDQQQLADKVTSSVLPELGSIDGVNEATLTGTRDEVITITPDQAKLTAAGLTEASISTALSGANRTVPAGTLTQHGQSLSVQVGTPLGGLTEIQNLYLSPAASTRPLPAP